ncbi:MAG: ribbon-helix-helix domain-containing protein [Rhodospirillales bacterium]|nr:ribbon-helix-helix domain-containing protein [Alphaproteobacteria bacterium]USO03488.1 MAG: ribbon-helix-helix domain-containing protein [Rhodospirillales bacterium]
MTPEDYLCAPVVKHSVKIAGHATSVSIEKPFWDLLNRDAQKRGLSLNALITEIDEARGTNLSSALRLYVLHNLTQQ